MDKEAPVSSGGDDEVGLPGASPSLVDDVPILQKHNDGPISRILKTVEENPAKALSQLNDEVDIEPDPTPIIKLTIREYKYKDPLAPQAPRQSPIHSSNSDINEPLPATATVFESEREYFQDKLNLASGTKVRDSFSSVASPSPTDNYTNVDVVSAATTLVDEIVDTIQNTLWPGTTTSTGELIFGQPIEVNAVAAQPSKAQSSPVVDDRQGSGIDSLSDDDRPAGLVHSAACSISEPDQTTPDEAHSWTTTEGYSPLEDLPLQQAFEVHLVDEGFSCGQRNCADSGAVDLVQFEPVISSAKLVQLEQGNEEASEVAAAVINVNKLSTDCDVNLAQEKDQCPVGDEDEEEPQEATGLKIKPVDANSTASSSSVGDLVTRIASYYCNRDDSSSEDHPEGTYRPPVPLKTYQWEDIKRAKQQGGYPWTHLYKPPLGPEDEPEILQRIRTLPKQRKRFEQKLIEVSDGSPKSLKRVRIDNAVLVQETEKYIQSLDDNNNVTDCTDEPEIGSLHEEPSSQVEDETPKSTLKRKRSLRRAINKLSPRGFFTKKVHNKEHDSIPNEEKDGDEKPKSKILCHPIVVKLRELAKRQIKRTPSKKPPPSSIQFLKPQMEERQQILQLRESPKAGGREISSYIERQESDDIIEIVQLEESPGEGRRRKANESSNTFVEPDEILHLHTDAPPVLHTELPDEGIEPTISELLEEEMKNDPPPAPKKVARRQKEHLYEDIDDDPNEHLNFTLMTPDRMAASVPNIDLTLIGGSGDFIKSSLANQDDQLLNELQERDKRLSDLLTQSSGEDEDGLGGLSPKQQHLLAPISSVDSASSEDERKVPLSTVTEESDRESVVPDLPDTRVVPTDDPSHSVEKFEIKLPSLIDLDDRPVDEDIRKENITLQRSVQSNEEESTAMESDAIKVTTITSAIVSDRWKGMSDHEYEPVCPPPDDDKRTPSPNRLLAPSAAMGNKSRTGANEEDEDEVSIQDMQNEIESRYFALTPTTTGSRTDCEINTSAVDSSAIEDLPLDRGSRRRWNMQERSKQMGARFKTGAGKLKTKFKSINAPKTGRGSPKEKKKFKGSEFTKLKSMSLFNNKSPLPATERPTILVSDTTVEVDHKTSAPKASFASKFKSPDFLKFKERFTKSESQTISTPTPVEETSGGVDELDHESSPVTAKTTNPKSSIFKAPDMSLFKRFEFRKASGSKSENKPDIEVEQELENVLLKETPPMDSISPETDSGDKSPITPEPPITPDCYEGLPQDRSSTPATKPSRFKAPDLSKIRDFKRPQFTKFDFKRPEFHRPKFSKPDMSRFKMPDRFSSLRLKRTKSLKEPRTASTSDSAETIDPVDAVVAPSKKRFEFSTYPRIFNKIKRGAGNKASRAATPPPIIFTTMATSDGTSEAESRGLDNESGSYQKYGAADSEFDRETSVERRMREHFSKSMDSDEVRQPEILQTEEQRQIHNFNEENRTIHAISNARRDEFQQRKPFIHQDSDLVSEESAGKWAQLDVAADDDKLAEQAMINHLLQRDIERQKQNDLDRRSIPQSNKDTISSGSASDRQRTNVIEEIDDDEFFLRSKGISQDNIRIGEYISSAIREGLTNPSPNALAKVGQYDDRYYDDEADINLSEPMEDYGYDVPPRRPRRVKDSVESPEEPDEDYELQQDFDRDLKANEDDGYFTVPNRPTRRHQPQYESSEIPQDHDQRSFYDNESEIIMMDDEYEHGAMGYVGKLRMPPPTPPKVPRRKKKMAAQMIKRIEKMDGFTGRSVSNSVLPNGDNIVVYRTEFEIPLATPEKFTPVPTPRRTRSRSQLSRFTDDDRTSHGAESLVSDAAAFHQENQRNVLELQKNGYAVIKKDPPPRPPAPLRRKRSTKSLGSDRQFATMPHMHRKASSPPPPRPSRNYSTIVPSRPPRTKSNSSLGDAVRPTKSSPDVTEYEEIGTARDLQSGAILNKMKDRPLPPPPRPDRTLPRRKREKKPLSDGNDEDHDDRDGGGERIVGVTAESSIDQQFSIEEVDMSTQTEPLPSDFECEELDISADMRTITPTQSKTLEDILKEEQEAEIERAQQTAAELNLNRGIQRFRDANQRSMSEKSWASKDRPKTPSLSQLSPHSSAFRMDNLNLPAAETEMDEVGKNKAVNECFEPGHGQFLMDIEEDNFNIVQEEIEKDDEDKILNIQPETSCNVLSATSASSAETTPSSPPRDPIQSTEEFINEESEIERQAQRLENIIDKLSESPPVAPPRRKSSAGEPKLTNDLSTRLQLTDLDVDRLNVNQLTAGNILASEIQTNDLECRSSNLMNNLPQEVIDQIAQRVLNSETMQNRPTADNTSTLQPPAGFFAIPTEYLNSIPPSSFYQLRDPPTAPTTESQPEPQIKFDTPQEGTSSDEPSVLRLGGQFLGACGSAFMRNVREWASKIPPSVKVTEDGRRDVNVALLFLIIVIVCLMAFVMGGSRTVHHHHWDFFNPPGANAPLD